MRVESRDSWRIAFAQNGTTLTIILLFLSLFLLFYIVLTLFGLHFCRKAQGSFDLEGDDSNPFPVPRKASAAKWSHFAFDSTRSEIIHRIIPSAASSLEVRIRSEGSEGRGVEGTGWGGGRGGGGWEGICCWGKHRCSRIFGPLLR